MLEYLRNAADKPVAKILIGILAFSFIGWGVAEWIFGGGIMGDTTLVRVGDKKISVQQFNMEKSRLLSQMSREQQRAVYTDASATQQLTDRVLMNLTMQQMAQNRADELGFVVTDKRIADEIRMYPEFQHNGEFSTYVFDNVLRNSGYTEADFANILRSQIKRSYVLGAISAPVHVADFMVHAIYNARNASRKIDYATVKFSEFKVGAPTDENLRQYYAQNPQVIPEHRTLSYVLVPADTSKPDAYDAGYAVAVKVEDDIIAGDSLESAARKNNAKYVSLKPFSADNRPTDSVLTDALIARAFTMDAGTESEMIETKKGFVIMRVEKIDTAHNAEFDSVKKNLVADWKRDEQRKQAYVRANELLVDLNKDGKLSGKKSVTISRTSGAPVAVLSAAFNSDVGTNTLVPSDDAFYVLHIDSETMPKADSKKIDALRKELTKTLAQETTDDYNSFLLRQYPVKVNEKVYHKFIAK